MNRLQIAVGVLCFLSLINVSYAEEVHILCPEPTSIQFNLNKNPNGNWDRYEAVGFSKVIQGNVPSFAMTILNDSALPPTEMYGASYIEDGTFICNYVGWKGKAEHNAFPLVYGDLRPEFPGGCYFKANHDTECNGNIQDCELVCRR